MIICREWLQVEARVPERLLLHPHQAPRRLHRRHQHRLLRKCLLST